METVEVVIRLPKDLYKGIKYQNGELETEYVCDELMKAVDNGTILPKGHGDLKDVSNLLTVTDYDGENEKTYVLYDEIKHAPTIIEADKGEDINGKTNSDS